MINKEDLKIISSILESQSSGIILLDSEARFIFANGWITKSLDKNISELTGENFFDCFPEISNRIKFAIESAIKGSKSAIVSERLNKNPIPIKNPDTSKIMTSQRIYIYPIKVKDEFCVKIVLIDFSSVTKRENHIKEIANELDESRSKLIEESKMIVLGKMAGGLAHEINNPLGIIKSNITAVKMLISKATLDRKEKINSMLKTCEKTCDRMSKIVGGLLIYSDEEKRVASVRTGIQSLMQSIQSLMGEKLLNNNITLKIAVPEDDFDIYCVPADISQIVLSFIENSEYECKEHAKNVITLSVVQTGKNVKIAVGDDGPDVPTEHEGKIMDPFYTTKPFGSGTGLGLSVSMGLARNHQGTISYQSKKEFGKKEFVLTLPKVLYKCVD